MNILFICRHNRFRSKVAEAFFNFYIKQDKFFYNRNKENKARSRGIIKDIDTSENVVEVLKGHNIELKSKKSIKVSEKDLKWADLIVVVADDIKNSDLKVKDKKIIKWKISDVDQNDINRMRQRVNIIEKKVLSLLKNFK